jgi:hypothetical protein
MDVREHLWMIFIGLKFGTSLEGARCGYLYLCIEESRVGLLVRK